MLSLHLTVNGHGTETYWPFDSAVQIEYSGPEGINLYFSDSDAIRGARLELSAELVEAMYWHYMRHNMPLPDKRVEIIEQSPF